MKWDEYMGRLALIGYKIREGSSTRKDTDKLKELALEASKTHGFIARNMAASGEFAGQSLPDMQPEKKKV